MDLIVAIPLAVVGIIAALGAYGTWLIGQDSDAEATAREISGESAVLSDGWVLLDWLRVGDLPVVGAIEDYLSHLREVAANALGDDSADEDTTGERD